MALQWQLVNIPVDGGLNDKASPILVEAPASTLMFDAVFDKNGELLKRNGWKELNGTLTGTAHTIGANEQMLAAKTSQGTRLFRQSQEFWARLSGAITMLHTPHTTGSVVYGGDPETSMTSANTTRPFVQAVEQNGFIVTFTKSPTEEKIHVRAVDVETGDVAFDNNLLDLSFFLAEDSDFVMKAVKHSTRYVSLVLGDPSSGLVSYRYDTSTHTITQSATPLATPAHELFDVCHGASVSVPPAIAYRNGSDGVTVKTLQTDGEFSSSSVSFNSTTYDRVAINTYNTGYVIVAREISTARLHFFEIDTSFTTLNSHTGGTLINSQLNQLSIIQTLYSYGSISNSYIIAFCSVVSGVYNTEVTFRECKATSGVLTTAAFPNSSDDVTSAYLYTDLYYHNENLCVYVVPDINVDEKALDGAIGIAFGKTNNLDGTRFNVFSKISAFDEILQGPLLDAGQYVLDRPSTGTADAQGTKVYINASKRNASVILPTVYALAHYVPSGSTIRHQRYGKAILFSGGCTTAVGTSAECEFSPLTPPFISDVTVTGGSPAGSYFYRAVAEYTDDQGLVHRSAPSNALEGQRGATGSIVTIKLFRPSNAEGLTVALYRTTDGGSVFYRLTSGATTAFADTVALYPDAVIADNEVLYTDSGELEAQSMFATDDILVTSSRIFAIPSDDKTSVWYTKTFQPGIFPEFNSALRVSIPVGGDNIALGQLDDKVIVFKKNAIFVIYGQGPNNTGQGGDYTYEQLQTNVGCIEPATVVSYPDGLMFAHSSGIQAINRSLQVTPIGIPVDNVDPTTIRTAVTIAHKHQVRFSVPGTDNADPFTLYYSYLYNRWSRLSTDQVASALWTNTHDVSYSEAGQLVYLDSDNNVKFEASRLYGDDNGDDNVDLYYSTPWIKLAGIQGTQRVRRALVLLRTRPESFGASQGQGSATVDVWYDYDEGSVAQTKTWTEAEILAADQKQLELTLSRQKIQSVKFRIRLFADTGETVGDGYAIVGLTLDVGIKKGLYKQQAAALRV